MAMLFTVTVTVTVTVRYQNYSQIQKQIQKREEFQPSPAGLIVRFRLSRFIPIRTLALRTDHRIDRGSRIPGMLTPAAEQLRDGV